MTNKFLAQWVSVNERLPKDTDEVPIKDENFNDFLGIGSYREKDGWAISGPNYWKPTHWLEMKPLSNSEELLMTLEQNAGGKINHVSHSQT